VSSGISFRDLCTEDTERLRINNHLMTAHPKNSNHKIYSSLAFRLGEIVDQYEKLNLPEEKNYLTTLYICALQNLLTQFCEVNKNANSMGNSRLPIWGIDETQVSKFPSDRIKCLGEVLCNIRDVLSHPFAEVDHLAYESKDENGTIVSYEFSRKKNFRVTVPVENLKTLIHSLVDFLKSGGADPIRLLGRNPASDSITDASVNLDQYLYEK
jgi:hypothetical protein